MAIFEEQIICIKLCFKLEKGATETYELIKEAFGDAALSRSRTFEWFSCFQKGREKTNDIRAVIKYICKKGMLPKEIYEDMVDTLRENAPSYSTVKEWVAAFKLGRISTEDEHRPGRPVESVTQENIDKIDD
ncbi:hypothetical protein LAZ67_5004488 [Cordylochernes scorpioides]|uniref:Mos1 transposase HTH domain-containing protein n=1 Tax=Cordylochernes scorpioides TaxID=51811 RepID=A0ABY6KMX0_9ARAC|nr:hypothetical protein LAZ67_5004488 [Cordylochernes scorpioides]